MTAIYKVNSNPVIGDDGQFIGRFSRGMIPNLKVTDLGTAVSATISVSSTYENSQNKTVKLSDQRYMALTRATSAFQVTLVTLDSTNPSTIYTPVVTTIEAIAVNSVAMFIKRLSDTSALVVYGESNSPYRIKAVVLTVGGTLASPTVSVGTIYALDTTVGTKSCLPLDVKRISSPTNPTKFIIGYVNPDASNNYSLKVMTIDISGTVITANAASSLFTLNNTTGLPIIALEERDDDTKTSYDFIFTRPDSYDGTWAQQTNGQFTLTVTDLYDIFGTTATNNIITHYVEFTSGTTPPSNDYYKIAITGLNEGEIYPLDNPLGPFPQNTGNIKIYPTFLYKGALDISSGVISNISATTAIKLAPGLNISSNSDTLKMVKTAVSPVITASGNSFTNQFLISFKRRFGRSLYRSSSFSTGTCFAMITGDQEWTAFSKLSYVDGEHQVLGNGNISDIIQMNFYDDKNVFLGLNAANTSAISLVAAVYDDSQISVKQGSQALIIDEQALEEIMVGYAYSSGGGTSIKYRSLVHGVQGYSYPITLLMETPLITRTTQGRGAVFPTADKNKFLLMYGLSSSNWTFRIITLDGFV